MRVIVTLNNMRTRSQTTKVPLLVARRNNREYANLKECWKQTITHRKHFIDLLHCEQDYHRDDRACMIIDNWVQSIATRPYRKTFFTYYEVVGRTPSVHVYTDGLITNPSVIESLTYILIRKKGPNQIQGVPAEYHNWPNNFDFEPQHFETMNYNKVLNSINACIQRRIFHRQRCVVECSKRFDTTGHDVFLLMLQTLRAKLIYYRVG